jgi:hypothetical protein
MGRVRKLTICTQPPSDLDASVIGSTRPEADLRVCHRAAILTIALLKDLPIRLRVQLGQFRRYAMHDK